MGKARDCCERDSRRNPASEPAGLEDGEKTGSWTSFPGRAGPGPQLLIPASPVPNLMLGTSEGLRIEGSREGLGIAATSTVSIWGLQA